jgi:hypothetical protein
VIVTKIVILSVIMIVIVMVNECYCNCDCDCDIDCNWDCNCDCWCYCSCDCDYDFYCYFYYNFIIIVIVIVIRRRITFIPISYSCQYNAVTASQGKTQVYQALSMRWCLFYRCCGLQAIKYCANSPLARMGAQVPAWLAPMTDKQSLLPARAGRIN